MRRDTRLRLEGYAIIVGVVVVTAPIWLFCARLWWSWTYALLTKPWAELFCFGNGCLS